MTARWEKVAEVGKFKLNKREKVVWHKNYGGSNMKSSIGGKKFTVKGIFWAGNNKVNTKIIQKQQMLLRIKSERFCNSKG